jgi:hypothetical protein
MAPRALSAPAQSPHLRETRTPPKASVEARSGPANRITAPTNRSRWVDPGGWIHNAQHRLEPRRDHGNCRPHCYKNPKPCQQKNCDRKNLRRCHSTTKARRTKPQRHRGHGERPQESAQSRSRALWRRLVSGKVFRSRFPVQKPGGRQIRLRLAGYRRIPADRQNATHPGLADPHGLQQRG